MCGITGIVSINNNPIDETVLRAMTRRLVHRGPNDLGTQVIPGPLNSGICVGLGQCRLSIIDLSPLGHQPMTNEDQTVWVNFSGEIYNYKEIRSDLIQKGHQFKSDTDTEVIVHGYEEYKERLFEKLSGMFAFALWDARRGRFVLARDRFGKKPLHYWRYNNGLAFASEIKAFFHHPEFHPQLDLKSLSKYLAYEYVPVPHTIYKDVFKVPPGNYLTYDGATISIKPYWDIDFTENSIGNLKQNDIEQTLVELLKKAIEKRLMSDVPLGAFLSGGIDSSTIIALMSELMDPHLIKTFSIGFEDKSFDESYYAYFIAHHFKTDHRRRMFRSSEMVDILPEVWNFLDEPLADASILPTYLLSKYTRESVTVALGGDGGDELFAGYDTFLAQRLARLYSIIPDVVTNSIVSPFVSRLPVSGKSMSFDFCMKQFIKGASKQTSIRNQQWIGSFLPDQQRNLFNPEISDNFRDFDVYEDLRLSLSGRKFRDWVDEMNFIYERFYLGENILTKIDRASMAVALEVRSPFLDLEFSEFVNRLPSRYKLHFFTRKFILKKALKNKLPNKILYRKKKGFGIPLTNWLRYDLRPMLEETFSEDRMKREGLFNFAYIRKLMDDHFEGRMDNRKQLWTLLMFEQWKLRFCPG
jgi:asparagine synthase (glutamine-hydrolysing)